MDITHDPITAGLVRGIPAAKVLVRKRQLFTVDGTWTRPANMYGGVVWVTGIGGGGSGGRYTSAQGGGGGELCVQEAVDTAGASSVAVTCGLGGAAATANSTPGNAGAPSSFGALLSLTGGVGGVSGGTQPTKSPGPRGGWVPGTGASTIPAARGETSAAGIYSAPGGEPAPSLQCTGGGGGLRLDDTGVGGGDASGTNQARGGFGYGAGGGASPSSNTGAGMRGAMLVEWDEGVTL